MAFIIICILIVLAVLLFLLELFVIPGISIAGIASALCAIYANYYAFSHLGTPGGFITLAVTVIAFVLALVYFIRSKRIDKLALNTEINSVVKKNGKRKLKKGDKGVTTTRLTQIGYALFDDEIYEVKSTNEFIEEQTNIVVTRISGDTIFVEKEQE